MYVIKKPWDDDVAIFKLIFRHFITIYLPVLRKQTTNKLYLQHEMSHYWSVCKYQRGIRLLNLIWFFDRSVFVLNFNINTPSLVFRDIGAGGNCLFSEIGQTPYYVEALFIFWTRGDEPKNSRRGQESMYDIEIHQTRTTAVRQDLLHNIYSTYQ